MAPIPPLHLAVEEHPARRPRRPRTLVILWFKAWRPVPSTGREIVTFLHLLPESMSQLLHGSNCEMQSRLQANVNLVLARYFSAVGFAGRDEDVENVLRPCCHIQCHGVYEYEIVSCTNVCTSAVSFSACLIRHLYTYDCASSPVNVTFVRNGAGPTHSPHEGDEISATIGF